VVRLLIRLNIRQKALQCNKLLRFLGNTLIWTVIIVLAVSFGSCSNSTFHTLAELFSVIIAFSAFVVVLNTYALSRNSYLTFLGIAFGFASIFEFLHLLTYIGIDILGMGSLNITPMLSSISRLIQSISLLASVLFYKRKLNTTLCITVYSFITAILIGVLLYLGSSLKQYTRILCTTETFQCMELLVLILFIAALIMLLINRKNSNYRVYKYMLLTLLSFVALGILLIMDNGMNGDFCIWAHILKLMAFFCIYKVIIQNILHNPIDSKSYEFDKMKNELLEKNYEISKNNEKFKSDIDDLHMIEKLLRKSKAWSRSIFEGSPIGIALLNIKGAVIEANPALECILGYSASEIKNIGISNITYIDDAESDIKLYNDLIEGNIEGYKIEKRYIRKDGKVIWTNVKMSYIQNVGQDFQFIIAMIEDITQQKDNEEKQLQLVKKLEEKNKELDNFAYIVSHDLKAPLRGIGSLANWLVTDYKDKLDKEGIDIINLMENRVERLKNFIDGILQYSRVTRVKENYVDVNLNKVVSEVIELISPPPNIYIKIEALPVVKGEIINMGQIFQNLISNSIKFMDKPEGYITIDYEDTGDYWKLSVTDNGAGIGEKYFDKIFMIFQTLQPRDKFESTGVGLSIVKKIIEANGGNIWLESEVGKGTTFYFTIPKNP